MDLDTVLLEYNRSCAYGVNCELSEVMEIAKGQTCYDSAHLCLPDLLSGADPSALPARRFTARTGSRSSSLGIV